MAASKQPAVVSSPAGVISRQLRNVIEAQGLSASAIGREAGVDPGVISRFLKGDRDIRLETLDRLADLFGLRLIEGARGRARPTPRPGKPPTRRTARPVRTSATAEPDDDGPAPKGEV